MSAFIASHISKTTLIRHMASDERHCLGFSVSARSSQIPTPPIFARLKEILDILNMVTGQLTRSEAESALKRLEGLRDDWQRQRIRWAEHHQKALDIKALQRTPSAALTYTVEVCCNQVGIATIRFNELVRLIQDFRACALYLVHLPIPEGPDASFRSALPDLWSIPHAAPGTTAVALPGQIAGFSAQMVPVTVVQGLSDQILIHNTVGDAVGFGVTNQMMPNSTIQQFPQQQQIQMTGFQQQGMFQPQPTGFQFQSNMIGVQQHSASPYSTQPLPPQQTQALYNQQLSFQQQSAEQTRINQFASNVFQQNSGFQPLRSSSTGFSSSASPLNPFNPNAPHGAVLDASQRYPAMN
ncbi:hypothetical protein O181_076263 [Austropuccinia psidii MF-1]|uniref:Uncharacterized protein n=1 Tax=Austropuccinia psidii MF-1 TaxID=1389203 RepID=A0A9Q3FEL5_9BASI|nr:hypothetical protein [Austropuccinia psidii MF-1]